MQGARRRPYVDMVKEGNAADDRPGRNPEGDGALWAHLFVGSHRNIDILLRALLLDLHPTSPPSHTCLVMKQVHALAARGDGRRLRENPLELLHLFRLHFHDRDFEYHARSFRSSTGTAP